VATEVQSGPSDGRRSPGSPNGRTATRPGPTVAPPKRRIRAPELAVGVLVTVAFALGAVLWHLNAVDKVPALSVAGPIERGEIIGAEDLRVTYVAADDPLARMDETQASRVVGRVALVDLAAGTLVTPSVVADGTPLGTGDGVAGLALDPGQYPALGIAPGDRVNVVRSVEAGTRVDGDVDLVVARGATVFAVEDLPSDRKLVSILTGEAGAEAVATLAGSGSLRLVLVAP
jgi:SAF domain